MKIIKYLLVAAVIFTLWVTSPIWMPRSKYSHNTTPTEIFIAIAEPLADCLEKICIEIGATNRLWWLKKTSED